MTETRDGLRHVTCAGRCGLACLLLRPCCDRQAAGRQGRHGHEALRAWAWVGGMFTRKASRVGAAHGAGCWLNGY